MYGRAELDWSRGREKGMTRQHNLSEKCLSKYLPSLFTLLNSQYSLSLGDFVVSV